MYPEQLCTPMRLELTSAGYKELKTADEVINIMSQKGTVLLMVNSVCGCAAGNARPAAIMATKLNPKPDYFTTVFAGQDPEATAKAREFMLPYPASSPSIALFKNGKVVHMIERHHIEGRDATLIGENLKSAFDSHC